MATYSLLTKVNGKADAYVIQRVEYVHELGKTVKSEVVVTHEEHKRLTAVQMSLFNLIPLDCLSSQEALAMVECLLEHRYNECRVDAEEDAA